MRMLALAILVLSQVATCQVATQILAYRAHYAPVLGAPLMVRKFPLRTEHSIYLPWQGIVWTWKWRRGAGAVVRQAWLWGAVPGAGGLLAAAALWSGVRGHTLLTGYGSGRWATRRDIRKAGL